MFTKDEISKVTLTIEQAVHEKVVAGKYTKLVTLSTVGFR